MTERPDSDIFILCFGDARRRDDGAGHAVAGRLGADPELGARVATSWARGTERTASWPEHDEVVIVDTVRSGAPPGTVHSFDATGGRLPAKLFQSTATGRFGALRNLRNARASDHLPRRLRVYAIEGERFEFGTRLTPAVARAVDEVVAQIRDRLQRPGEAPPGSGARPAADTTDAAATMITPEFLDEARAALGTLGAYNDAAEWAMTGIAVAAGLRIAWWTGSPFPISWKEDNQRVLYEEWCAVPIGSPIYCFTPAGKGGELPPSPGGWMLEAFHDVHAQRLTLKVLSVRDGSAEDWWSLWEPVQTRQVAGEPIAEGPVHGSGGAGGAGGVCYDDRVFAANVAGCRLVWTSRQHRLAALGGDAEISAAADELRALAETI